MLRAMSGNWILTATGAGSPVGEACAVSVARCTWPRDAAAKGIGSKESNKVAQESPRDSFKTCYIKHNISHQSKHDLIWDYKVDDDKSNLHLPIRHIMSAILDPSKYIFNILRKQMGIYLYKYKIQGCQSFQTRPNIKHKNTIYPVCS